MHGDREPRSILELISKSTAFSCDKTLIGSLLEPLARLLVALRVHVACVDHPDLDPDQDLGDICLPACRARCCTWLTNELWPLGNKVTKSIERRVVGLANTYPPLTVLSGFFFSCVDLLN